MLERLESPVPFMLRPTDSAATTPLVSFKDGEHYYHVLQNRAGYVLYLLGGGVSHPTQITAWPAEAIKAVAKTLKPSAVPDAVVPEVAPKAEPITPATEVEEKPQAKKKGGLKWLKK